MMSSPPIDLGTGAALSAGTSAEILNDGLESSVIIVGHEECPAVLTGKVTDSTVSGTTSESEGDKKRKRKRGYNLRDKRDIVEKYLRTEKFLPQIDSNGRQLDDNGINAFLQLEAEKAPHEIHHTMLTKWIKHYRLGCFEPFPDNNLDKLNCNKSNILM